MAPRGALQLRELIAAIMIKCKCMHIRAYMAQVVHVVLFCIELHIAKILLADSYCDSELVVDDEPEESCAG